MEMPLTLRLSPWIVPSTPGRAGREMLDLSAWADQRHSEGERMLIATGYPPQHAAGFVHDDSSRGKALEAGCQINLRLGCCPEYS